MLMYLYKSEIIITKILIEEDEKYSSIYSFKFVIIYQTLTLVQWLECFF